MSRYGFIRKEQKIQYTSKPRRFSASRTINDKYFYDSVFLQQLENIDEHKYFDLQNNTEEQQTMIDFMKEANDDELRQTDNLFGITYNNFKNSQITDERLSNILNNSKIRNKISLQNNNFFDTKDGGQIETNENVKSTTTNSSQYNEKLLNQLRDVVRKAIKHKTPRCDIILYKYITGYILVKIENLELEKFKVWHTEPSTIYSIQSKFLSQNKLIEMIAQNRPQTIYTNNADVLMFLQSNFHIPPGSYQWADNESFHIKSYNSNLSIFVKRLVEHAKYCDKKTVDCNCFRSTNKLTTITDSEKTKKSRRRNRRNKNKIDTSKENKR